MAAAGELRKFRRKDETLGLLHHCRRGVTRAKSTEAMKPIVLLILPLLIVAFTGCSKDSDAPPKTGRTEAEKGRAIYLANCVACHNNDPSRDGPIGPAVKGSSRELLEARVLTSSYPPGYKPKRPTKVMPQFPFLRNEIPYLAAYLNSSGQRERQQE